MNQQLPKQDAPGRLGDLIESDRPWPLADVAVFMRRLAQQVQTYHRRGRFHRAIDALSVTINREFHPLLDDPPEERRFGGEYSDPEFCPPELVGRAAVTLPSDIASAAARLAEGGRKLDPRRIDVYQMGVLFYRLASGSSIVDYLYSPTAKARLPSDARCVVDQMLGHDAATRLGDCGALLQILDRLIGQSRIESGAELSADAPKTDGALRTSGNLPFSRLGPYRIQGMIGSGGMGDVYRGHDESLDRLVAVKVLPRELAQCDDFVRRFRAEATAAAKISHPNVAPIHFVGQDAGYHFFAMRYIDGESLAERLRLGGRPRIEEALRIVRQCLRGLEAAHSQGLIHRDIKPANILLDRHTNGVVIVDFGLVRRIDDSAGLTATGLVMGTVEYMAPEQAQGEPVDHRADIYSLGVVFYQLLSGRLPFEAESLTSMLFQHAYEAPFPLEEAAPSVPLAVRAIVAHMMAKQPNRRYSTCGEVLQDLQAVREGRTLTHAAEKTDWSAATVHDPPSGPIKSTRPNRHRWMIPTVTAGVCLSVAVLLFTWHGLSATSDESSGVAWAEPADTLLAEPKPDREEPVPVERFVFPSGAVAVLTFEEDTVTKRTGAALVQDSSPGANHFSGLERIRLAAGKVGSGLSLRDYSLHLPRALLNGRSEYTLTAWVYHRKEGGLFRFYLEQGERTADAGAEPVFQIDVSHLSSLNTYACNTRATEQWMAARTPAGSMAPDCWNFIALRLRNGTSGGGELTTRINQESYTLTLQNVDCPHGNRTQLGPADGIIDELAIFDRALSDEEIQTLFERGSNSGRPARTHGSRP